MLYEKRRVCMQRDLEKRPIEMTQTCMYAKRPRKETYRNDTCADLELGMRAICEKIPPYI